MAYALAVVLLTTLCLQHVTSQGIPGSCPQFLTKNSYDLQRGGGLWYELHRLSIGIADDNTKCVNKTREPTSDGGYTSNISETTSCGSMHIRRRNITAIAGQPGKFSVSGDGDELNEVITANIIDTDFDNYIVVASCFRIGSNYGLKVFVEARQTELPLSVIIKINAALLKLQLTQVTTLNYMIKVPQNC